MYDFDISKYTVIQCCSMYVGRGFEFGNSVASIKIKKL